MALFAENTQLKAELEEFKRKEAQQESMNERSIGESG
jgi:hypothetical protein